MRFYWPFLLLAVTASEAPAQALRGSVRDATNHQTVPAALVSVLSLDNRTLASATTDANGGFLLKWNSAGAVRLRAERLGYVTSTSSPFGVGAQDTAKGSIYMAVTAIPIEAIIVEEQAIAMDLTGEFADIAKRRELGLGHFIDRDKVVNSGAMWVSELLHAVPGISLVPDPQIPTAVQAYTKASSTFSGTCPMQVFLNGRIFKFNGLGVNVVPAADIQAVEIYRGLADTPAIFGGDHVRCGVIAIWTTRW
jgi:hypothetical protein